MHIHLYTDFFYTWPFEQHSVKVLCFTAMKTDKVYGVNYDDFMNKSLDKFNGLYMHKEFSTDMCEIIDNVLCFEHPTVPELHAPIIGTSSDFDINETKEILKDFMSNNHSTLISSKMGYTDLYTHKTDINPDRFYYLRRFLHEIQATSIECFDEDHCIRIRVYRV